MKVILIISILFIIVFIIVGILIVKRNIYIWLWDYLFGTWRKKVPNTQKTKHIMFCYVDHFEPHLGKVDDEIAQRRMETWLSEYPVLAKKYTDADGYFLKHTWFYPYDELSEIELEQLNQLCKEGLGEVEFHLHHKNDTSDSLKAKLKAGLKVFNKYGIAITEDDQITYGFIHGNWALDNSIKIKGNNFCGVNNEISLLKETGCYADFTFPAYLEQSQPKFVNNIFYAIDDPHKPKSYNKGIQSKVGIDSDMYDLMLVQGPLMLNWKRRKLGFFPNIEDGNIHKGNVFHKSKIDLWIKANIHVHGKKDWIFVKVFTHGASEKNYEQVLGHDAESLFDYLTQRYNDGENYILHFVTAREMYNIIRAAENNEKGDPNQYRDYLIKRYKNTI